LAILILGKSGRFVKIKYLSYYVVGIKTSMYGVYPHTFPSALIYESQGSFKPFCGVLRPKKVWGLFF